MPSRCMGSSGSNPGARSERGGVPSWRSQCSIGSSTGTAQADRPFDGLFLSRCKRRAFGNSLPLYAHYVWTAKINSPAICPAHVNGDVAWISLRTSREHLVHPCQVGQPHTVSPSRARTGATWRIRDAVARLTPSSMIFGPAALWRSADPRSSCCRISSEGVANPCARARLLSSAAAVRCRRNPDNAPARRELQRSNNQIVRQRLGCPTGYPQGHT